MTPEDLAAHIEIRQVLYRYCRGVDRGDQALIASVYHPGAIDAHGPWVGEGHEFARFLVPAMDGVPLIGQHHITNALIEIDGDTADVESYYLALHPDQPEGGEAQHVLVGGRYLDRFERRDSVWKIADRKVLIDVARPLGPLEPWPAASQFLSGGRREGDPSHR